jgi:hypothetical protein
VRTADTVRLIGAHGGLLREFAVEANEAALSGKRLALQSSLGIEIYDTASGERTARFPAASIEHLERNILVTANGNTVTLRKLGNHHTIRIRGAAHARLEPPGLFADTFRRVTFTPMKDVLRRLAG